MSITLTGRQLEITPAIRGYVEGKLAYLLNDPALKISSIKVVMEYEKKQFSTGLVVNCKNHVYSAKVEDFDCYKSFDSALDKIENQLTELRERIVTHKREGLSGVDARNAEHLAEE